MKPTVLERIEQQRRRIDADRQARWGSATPTDHGDALCALLELVDALHVNRPMPPPEARSPEALDLWRRIVRQGHR